MFTGVFMSTQRKYLRELASGSTQCVGEQRRISCHFNATEFKAGGCLAERDVLVFEVLSLFPRDVLFCLPFLYLLRETK